ncbi:hypothetical protein [Paraflavitalea sp. CAU 1676]|uniref:hypothetical protein n=1 Tax=Paraflavitalea sp. CAU 1676 TaxID=3032598 RepID=UPI0023DCBC40|nr:hypothetical protein [Paraflavitalea sp. CAU 1676]MDF2189376.1 hypothetical protein [Paraflavitalea sp. CAU 1676]
MELRSQERPASTMQEILAGSGTCRLMSAFTSPAFLTIPTAALAFCSYTHFRFDTSPKPIKSKPPSYPWL